MVSALLAVLGLFQTKRVSEFFQELSKKFFDSKTRPPGQRQMGENPTPK